MWRTRLPHRVQMPRGAHERHMQKRAAGAQNLELAQVTDLFGDGGDQVVGKRQQPDIECTPKHLAC